MTAGDPEWNQTGTLFDGIRIWSERKKTLTKEDVKTRAKQAIKIQVANGIQFVRSHVDVTDPNLTALKALIEVREEVKDQVELQLVAFPQEGILSFPNGKELMTEAADLGADAMGGIPHFEFTREYGVESLKFLMKLAEQKIN
ncbi:cytosine deaminase [Lentilactobacillus kosonis]|uniref:Cytosine deaminase n=1 Tax=Lentilactobacillus kosonis TaxID=2810561 RepID=A0A401FME4_9LACO|nr:cytosine deaminase [Lentilactobacillus kosonis]